ncbi:Chromo domain-containing protein, partial [Cephalotus follicularis]
EHQVQPLAILNSRILADDSIQVLVQWTNMPPEEATWENLRELQDLFPTLHLEDKVSFVGSGNDTNQQTQLNEEEVTAEDEVAGRGKRLKKPSIKLTDYHC